MMTKDYAYIKEDDSAFTHNCISPIVLPQIMFHSETNAKLMEFPMSQNQTHI